MSQFVSPSSQAIEPSVSVSKIIAESNVAFGTSGARGLASALTDRVAYIYTTGFLMHLLHDKQISSTNMPVALGADLRPSSDRIKNACIKAAEDLGFSIIDFGKILSPALALYGISQKIPTIMITGSHIPEDRNGIKFTSPKGEITKDDEVGIKSRTMTIDPSTFDSDGFFKAAPTEKTVSNDATRDFMDRYLNFFPSQLLQGKTIGVYQHSAVARDLFSELYERLGAKVIALGRSDSFIPVDTEAIRDEDVKLAQGWAVKHKLDAIVSADGDSDRPLLSDERGKWIRGDVLGPLTAKFLNASAVATPVSCNSVVEKCNWFESVSRTKIGSPFVIQEMERLSSQTPGVVVGYEANGGFLLGSEVTLEGRRLSALPTRDSVLVHLAILSLSIQENKSLSELVNLLPKQYTASDRIKDFPTETSKKMLSELETSLRTSDVHPLKKFISENIGTPTSLDLTDGLRITGESGDVIHLRPSGNAPELRCYAESSSETKAVELVRHTLDFISNMQG